MNLTNMIIVSIFTMCANTFYYCDLYQIITGIDVYSLVANNPADIQTIMAVVFNTVHAVYREIPTEVFLQDSDLWELLNYAIQESGSGNVISAQILRELGLYSNSIIAYLISLGFSIIA